MVRVDRHQKVLVLKVQDTAEFVVRKRSSNEFANKTHKVT
jgi:hypothetical protein